MDSTDHDVVFVDRLGNLQGTSGLLRHVGGPSANDPSLVLIVAERAARHPACAVAAPTLVLLRRHVKTGALDSLPGPEAWRLLAEGMMERRPSRMLEVLRDCGALQQLFPEVKTEWGISQTTAQDQKNYIGAHLMKGLDLASTLDAPLGVRFACFCLELVKMTKSAAALRGHPGNKASSDLLHRLFNRLGVSGEVRAIATIVAREHRNVQRSLNFSATGIGNLLRRCDAFDHPQRFREALLAWDCDASCCPNVGGRAYAQRTRLEAALNLTLDVDAAPIREKLDAVRADERDIENAIFSTRVAALSAGWDELPRAPN